MDYKVHVILQARILEYSEAFTFSRGSFQPRDQTQVSHIVGRCFTSCATRKAQEYWCGEPIPSPVDLHDPGSELRSPALQVDPLPTESLCVGLRWVLEIDNKQTPKQRDTHLIGRFSSAAQSCLTLCNPMNCSTPGLPKSQSLLKLTSIESVMPYNHLILCHPLLLLTSIFSNIRVSANELALRIRWPKYWSFSFNISPSNEHPGLISFRMDWLDLLAVQGTL